MSCRFVEGQLVRRSERDCPLDSPDLPGKRAETGSKWIVSHVASIGWNNLPHKGKDCWPIHVQFIHFRPMEYVCSCIFDPVGEENPAKVRELEEAR